MVFNKFLDIYKFKAYKKNLRFKKYNVGITKFIKNRKKYIVRKRVNSNLLLYKYSCVWSKRYLLYRTCWEKNEYQ